MPDREALAEYALELANLERLRRRSDDGSHRHSDAARRAEYRLTLNRQWNELVDKILEAADREEG